MAKKKYGKWLSGKIHLLTPNDLTHEGISYSKFMELLRGSLSQEDIVQECEEILYEHIFQ